MMLSAYRTAPQKERKAAAELREHGIRAYAPFQVIERRAGPRHRKSTIKVRVPIAPGYVFAASKPAFSKLVKNRIGAVARNDLGRLYPKRQIRTKTRPFQIGDVVKIKVGSFAELTGTITKDKGRVYMVDIELFGKFSSVAMHECNIQRFVRDG